VSESVSQSVSPRRNATNSTDRTIKGLEPGTDGKKGSKFSKTSSERSGNRSLSKFSSCNPVPFLKKCSFMTVEFYTHTIIIHCSLKLFNERTLRPLLRDIIRGIFRHGRIFLRKLHRSCIYESCFFSLRSAPR
jgi:hypothetical protein